MSFGMNRPAKSRWFLSSLVAGTMFATLPLDSNGLIGTSSALAQDEVQQGANDVAGSPTAPGTDRWTDSSGARTIEAQFLELNGVQLKLRKSDGAEAVLPLFRLDAASRRLARQRAKEMANGEGAGPVASANASLIPLAISENPVEFPENLTLQETFQLVETEYNKGNYLVEWDRIPAPYQGVIQDYVVTSLSKIEPAVIQEIEQLKKRWIAALREKRQYIINTTALDWDEETRTVVANAYEPLLQFIEALPPGEGFDVEAIKSQPLRNTMKFWLEKILPPFDRFVQAFPGAQELLFASRVPVSEAKFIIINDESAKVSISPPGRQPISTDWIKFNKKWVQKDYEKSIDQIYFANERLQKAEAGPFNQQIRVGITSASLAVGVLEAAQDQNDIDDIFRGYKSYASMLGPMMQMRGLPNSGNQGSSYPGSPYPGTPYPGAGYPGAPGSSGYQSQEYSESSVDATK